MSRSKRKPFVGIEFYFFPKGRKYFRKAIRQKVRTLVHRLMADPEEDSTVDDVRDVNMSVGKSYTQWDTRIIYNPFTMENPERDVPKLFTKK